MTRAAETVNVKLTKAELWAIWQNFEAAFTDPDEMTDIERAAIDKIESAHARIAKAQGDGQ